MRLVDRIFNVLQNRYVIVVGDFAESLGIDKKIVANILHYLYRRGRIHRIAKGIYTLKQLLRDPLIVSTAIHYPSYISLSTALSLQNVIDQVVPVIEVVTSDNVPRTRRRIQINTTSIILHRFPPKLMFGYRYRESKVVRGYYYYIAKPEKAILDYVYKRGDPEEIFTVNWGMLNTKLLKEYVQEYPPRVRRWLERKLNNL